MENRECGSSTGSGKMKIEKQKRNELGITDRARFVPSFLFSRSSYSYSSPIPDLHFQVLVPSSSVKKRDQFRLLGNCPPTPPLNQH